MSRLGEVGLLGLDVLRAAVASSRPEVGAMRDLWVYIRDVVGYWLTGYWCLTAIPEILSYMVPQTFKAIDHLDQYIAPEKRQTLYRALFVVGLLIAGYMAWDEQYRIAKTKSPEEFNRMIGELQTQIVMQKAQIDGLSAWQWQGLDANQKDALLAGILKLSPQEVFIACSDTNCMDLGRDIANVIAQAEAQGWTVDGPRVSIRGAGTGIFVYAQSEKDSNLMAAVLREVLHEPVRAGVDPAPYLTIGIGAKKAQ